MPEIRPSDRWSCAFTSPGTKTSRLSPTVVASGNAARTLEYSPTARISPFAPSNATAPSAMSPFGPIVRTWPARAMVTRPPSRAESGPECVLTRSPGSVHPSRLPATCQTSGRTIAVLQAARHYPYPKKWNQATTPTMTYGSGQAANGLLARRKLPPGRTRPGQPHRADEPVPECVRNVKLAGVVHAMPRATHSDHVESQRSLARRLLKPVRDRRHQVGRARPGELPFHRLVAEPLDKAEQRLSHI